MNPKILLSTEKSSLWCVENYSADPESDFELLNKIYCQQQPKIFIMGKVCNQRRDVGFYSNEIKQYGYNKIPTPAMEFKEDSILSTILEKVNCDFNTTFNGVLVNKYNNGSDYIGAHSDNEKELDKTNSSVISIGYGTTRKFRIKNKLKQTVLDYDHKPGTLLVMDGEFQKEFTHEIPKQLKIKDCRISLTFRYHTPSAH